MLVSFSLLAAGWSSPDHLLNIIGDDWVRINTSWQEQESGIGAAISCGWKWKFKSSLKVDCLWWSPEEDRFFSQMMRHDFWKIIPHLWFHLLLVFAPSFCHLRQLRHLPLGGIYFTSYDITECGTLALNQSEVLASSLCSGISHQCLSMSCLLHKIKVVNDS